MMVCSVTKNPTLVVMYSAVGAHTLLYTVDTCMAFERLQMAWLMVLNDSSVKSPGSKMSK